MPSWSDRAAIQAFDQVAAADISVERSRASVNSLGANSANILTQLKRTIAFVALTRGGSPLFKIIATIAFLTAPAFDEPAAKSQLMVNIDYPTRQACAEYLSGNGKVIGLVGLQPFASSIRSAGHLIYSVTLECKEYAE